MDCFFILKFFSRNSDHFANIAIAAVKSVKSGKSNIYHLDSLTDLKHIGKSIDDTEILDGFGLNCTKASKDMPYEIKDAKIACIDFALEAAKMKMGVQVVVSDPEQLNKIRDKEIEMGLNKLNLIIKSGANVILTTGTIRESYCRILAKHNIMGIKFVSKSDIKKIANASGASLISDMNYDKETKEMIFDSSLLGRAESVSQIRVADNECILIKK